MRKLYVVLTVCAAMICAQSVAVAQTTTTTTPATPAAPSTSVDGKAVTGVSWLFGNNTTGGWSGGTSMGDFEASGLCVATGRAKADGKGSGAGTTGPNSASSFADALMSSYGAANGSISETTHVSGTAQQGDWAGTGVDGNFANGGSTTAAQYDGSGGPKSSGSGVADGKTVVSATSSPTSAQAEVMTDGTSAAVMRLGPDGTGTSSANGHGMGAAMSSVGGGPDGKYAGATLLGDAAYNAVGTRVASGSLTVKGTTAAMIGPTSAEAASSVVSTAHATGTGCGSGCGKP